MTLPEQLEAIRKIDEKAAEYIEEIVIPRYDGIENMRHSMDLLDHFLWQSPCTPQGYGYWFDIYLKLCTDGLISSEHKI